MFLCIYGTFDETEGEFFHTLFNNHFSIQTSPSDVRMMHEWCSILKDQEGNGREILETPLGNLSGETEENKKKWI
jgi:hypothetical protein